MRDDRERGDDAELGAREERGCDENPVHEIVEGVPDQDHEAAAPVIVRDDGLRVVRFAFLHMTVPPEHELFEHEEDQNAGEYGRCHRLRAARHAECVRQHFDEDRAQERADGVADEDGHLRGGRFPGEKRGGENRKQAAQRSGDDDPRKSGHEALWTRGALSRGSLKRKRGIITAR